MRWGLAVILAIFMTAASTNAAFATSDSGAFPPLFDTVGYKNHSLEALPQWRRVLDEIDREKSLYHGCGDAFRNCLSKSLLAWQAMIKSQAGLSKMTQLRAVNRFVNRWEHVSDIDNHATEDHWSSPLTFLQQSGDCEDYVIMKYVTLREMGFAPEELRIVIVRDTLRDLAHAVLAVHVDSEVYVLDNLFQAVLPQARIRQYLPYYSVNEDARWSHLPNHSLMLSSSPWTVIPSAGPKD